MRDEVAQTALADQIQAEVVDAINELDDDDIGTLSKVLRKCADTKNEWIALASNLALFGLMVAIEKNKGRNAS